MPNATELQAVEQESEISIEAQIQEYIEALSPQVFELESMAKPVISRLPGGHHNANYLITFSELPEAKFVLRFYPNQEAENDLIALEYELLKKLDGSIAPKAVHLGAANFTNGAVLIMEFVEGTHKPYIGMETSAIKELAELFARLHDNTSSEYNTLPGNPPATGTHLDFARSAINQWIIKPLATINLSDYSEASEMIEKSLARLEVLFQQDSETFSKTTYSLLQGQKMSFGQILAQCSLTGLNRYTAILQMSFLHYLQLTMSPLNLKKYF